MEFLERMGKKITALVLPRPCSYLQVVWSLRSTGTISFFLPHLLGEKHKKYIAVPLLSALRGCDTQREGQDGSWINKLLIVLSIVCPSQARVAVLTAYGLLAACHLLGTRGLAVVLLHMAVSFSVAQLRKPFLCWAGGLTLLSTLHLDFLGELQVRLGHVSLTPLLYNASVKKMRVSWCKGSDFNREPVGPCCRSENCDLP